MTSPLFGRSRELARLHEALAGVASGTAALAYIEGEPGIGKSALLGEVTAYARELGFRVFAARAEELEQDRPFHAIYEALGCRAGGDGRREEIDRLLGSPSADGGVFFRLIDAFEDLAESEALSGPALITIDDLQWADAGTIRALGSMCRRMGTFPLGIVATLRREPRSEELTALLRATSSLAIQIALRQLDKAALVGLVEARLGARPGPKLRAHIAGAGGNPFYILELLGALGAESAIRSDETMAEIEGPALPPSLVLTLLHRLSALPDRTLEILRSAAVLGASFSIENLATGAGVTNEEALAAVQSLRSQDVFADEGEKVRFRHDLIREAVYEDLGEPVRVSMHRRIGRALAEAGASLLEVSGHLVRGALPGDTEAAQWMIEAANDPAVDGRTACVLLERALEICPSHPQRSSLALQLAWGLMRLAAPLDAIPHLQRHLSQASDIAERFELSWRLMIMCFAAGRSRDMRSWAKQVSTMAPQIGDPEQPQILLRVAWADQLLGDLQSALALNERAGALAVEPMDVMTAHHRSSGVLTLLGRPGEALPRSEKALSEPAGRDMSLDWTHYGWALGDLDRIDEAETALSVARTTAERDGSTLSVAKATMESALLHYSVGRWDDALVYAETAATISDELDFSYQPMPDPACIMEWIAYHQQDEALHLRTRSIRPRTDDTEVTLTTSLKAVVAFDRGEIVEAGRSARDLLRRITKTDLTQRREFDVLPVLARVALGAGDKPSARLARETAAKLAERSDAPGVALADARCRAIVDSDVAGARQAIGLARCSPRVLLAAGAFEDAAAVLERDEAVGVLTEALHMYEQMGAVHDHARVAARLGDLGLRSAVAPVRARAVSGWDALTGAELAVVRLAAEGLTNREIGSRLSVSHRTVATHLSHVFDKLALRSRVELAREAANRFGCPAKAAG